MMSQASLSEQPAFHLAKDGLKNSHKILKIKNFPYSMRQILNSDLTTNHLIILYLNSYWILGLWMQKIAGKNFLRCLRWLEMKCLLLVSILILVVHYYILLHA